MSAKKGILLLAGLLLASFLPLLFRPADRGGAWAVIRVDGIVERKIPLGSGRDETFVVKTLQGRNTVQVQGGAIAVTDSDCPDHICMRSGTAKHPGDVIACLPHKLLIEIRDAPAP